MFQPQYGNIKVSDFAIVLPRYDGTLKDLLETRGGNSLTGYEALKQSDFESRMAAILPFVKAIVKGLQALYTGGHAHLDLKPGNIFYRKTAPDDFEVVIADIGFINPITLKSDVNTKIIDSIAYNNIQRLGTRHYRSPEQKDYSDVCDAEIKIKEGEIYIIVRDPKFRDTLIHQGDYISISKYESKSLYTIETFEKKDDSDEIVIKVKDIPPKERKLIEEEAKTQVVFYKRQYIKTDLFGIGAIAI